MSMKAIRPVKPGGPEVLVLEEHAIPVPRAGQVLVRTEAIGVNYIDVYHRTGLYETQPPIPLGVEGAGVVEAVAPDVGTPRVGERVVWSSGPGSYATHVVVPAERAVPIPAGIDARLAATVFLQGMTAHYLSRDTFPLRPGHVALVHAAAGGVGLLLVQLAKAAGARVLGTVSTEAKAGFAKQAGVDDVILYREQDFEVETRRLTAGTGVDVVYDSVGRTTFQRSLRSLKPRGFLVLYGQSSGPVEPIDPQVLSAQGSLFLTRPTLLHYTLSRADLLERARQLFEAVSSGVLKPRAATAFSLADARSAHEALEARLTAGKLLLMP